MAGLCATYSGFDEQTGIHFDGTVFPNQDFSGNRIARTPRFFGNGGLSYLFNVPTGTLEVAADAHYNSGGYFTAQNRFSSKADDYTVANARISYFNEAWQLRVTAFGKNINDARYFYNLTDFDFGSPALLAPPATYGIRLNWDF